MENNLRINYKNSQEDSLGRGFIGNNNWDESLILSQFLGVKGSNMFEQVDYLHLLYLGSQDKIKVYDVSGKKIDYKLCEKLLVDKIKSQSHEGGNWIDADYKTSKKVLEVHSDHIFDNRGNIINYKSEVLDNDTLMENKLIDVIDFITKNHTSQGHISKKVKKGNFSSYFPRSYNDSVARFFAVVGGSVLICSRYPSSRNSNLGVDVVAPRKQ